MPASKSSQGWSDVFGKLKERGVRQIDLVISDGLVRIEDAVVSHFSGASHRLCLVHQKGRLDKLVKQADQGKLQKDLNKVFQMDQQEDTPEVGYER